MAKTLYAHEVITMVRETSGRNDKMAILTKHTNTRGLREIFRLALDPMTQFYIKKIPDYQPQKHGSELHAILPQLKALSTRKVTGTKAKEYLVRVLETVDSEDAKVIECIIKKDMKCGVSIGTANKVWKNLVLDYPCMLCEKYSEKNLERIKYPAIAQVKEDGMRVNFIVRQNGVDVFSRNGKPLDILVCNHFRAEIMALAAQRGIVFDGELLVLDENGVELPRKKGNGILNKAIKGTIKPEEVARIRARIWDVIPEEPFFAGKSDIEYAKRLAHLQERFLKTDLNLISLVKTRVVHDFEEAKEFYDKIIASGGEGIILKNQLSIWENKRSKDHVKMKVENECELVIVEITEGTDKYEGMLGNFVCESSDGKLRVGVGSGFSDSQREEFFTPDMVGKIVTVKYNEVIDSENKDTMSLFLPIFIEVRVDKDEANSIKEIK